MYIPNYLAYNYYNYNICNVSVCLLPATYMCGLVFHCLCYQSSLVFKSCTMWDQRYRVGQVHKGQGPKSVKECGMYMYVCTCAQLKVFIMLENQRHVN